MQERQPAIRLTYLVIVFQDRYSGTYSGGAWFAVHDGDAVMDGLLRVHWLLEFGPGDEDCEAAEFWADPPDWIAVGGTPDQAVENLIRRISVTA